MLGIMYQHGHGTVQNYAEAVRWYRKAAEQGDPRAQFHLGVFHAKGEGIPQDDITAYKWTNIAGALAPPGKIRVTAAQIRNFLERRMSGSQITKSQRLAREWMEEHRARKQ